MFSSVVDMESPTINNYFLYLLMDIKVYVIFSEKKYQSFILKNNYKITINND